MGKLLMTTAGSALGASVLVLTGAGIASAQPVSAGSACQQVESTLSGIQSTLPSAASNPSALKSKIGTYASQLEQEASSGPTALKSAVGAFVSDLQAAGSGSINVSKLTSDANAIGAACASQSAPGGAPGTGGGSTAGVADPALFGVGGAVVLAGIGVVGLGSRRRRAARNNS
jgi:hypothetical protein